MMDPMIPEFYSIERSIEIYENERFWIGRGFSKAGLLPTERGPYSTYDGSLSWKTLKDASLSMLYCVSGVGTGVAVSNNGGNNTSSGSIVVRSRQGSTKQRRGWSYHEQDGSRNDSDKNGEDDDDHAGEFCGFTPCVGPEDGPTDSDGWAYFPDFTPQSILSPSKKRGMLDFVRRRKLRRTAVFRPDHFLPREVYLKCDFCDSKAVGLLMSAMLDALTLATLFLTGPLNKEITSAKILPLKIRLIDELSIGANCKSKFQPENFNAWEGIDRIRERLSKFAEKEVGRPGALTHLLQPDINRDLANAMPERRKVVNRYFDKEERLAIARLLVKDIDRYSFQLHCRNESCASVKNNGTCVNVNDVNETDDGDSSDSDCQFREVSCPNQNCHVSFSYKYRNAHDGECGFKLLPCTNRCGIQIPRNQMEIHIQEKCILRPAECPLSTIGCTAVVQAQDTPRHLNEHADKHFILISNRMMEYQAMFKKMQAKINLLEERNAFLEREMERMDSELSSKHDANVISNEVRKLNKRLVMLEGTCKNEFRRIEQDRRSAKK